MLKFKCLAVLLFLFSIFFFNTSYATETLTTVQEVAHSGKIKGVIKLCGENAPAGTSVYIPGKSFLAMTEGGTYEILWVPAATYNIVIKFPGMPSIRIADVVVEKKKVSILNIDQCPDNDNDGFTVLQNDCDDNNPSIFPGAPEVCDDGKDNNCDGVVDEGCATCTDDDNDGFFAQDGCGTIIDCIDSDSLIYPGALEDCTDQIDNNCDGNVNEGCPIDNDNDGYSADVDCDDSNASINPGATEECDGLDNDCDGSIDEDLPPQPCDKQEGVCSEAYKICIDSYWSGCIYPDNYQQEETLCDGLDNDCDGEIDEACFCQPPSVYAVAPNEIDNDLDVIITIAGDNFYSTTTVEIYNDETGIVTSLDSTFIDVGTIEATVPNGLPIGTYDINVYNGTGCDGSLTKAIIIY